MPPRKQKLFLNSVTSFIEELSMDWLTGLELCEFLTEEDDGDTRRETQSNDNEQYVHNSQSEGGKRKREEETVSITAKEEQTSSGTFLAKRQSLDSSFNVSLGRFSPREVSPTGTFARERQPSFDLEDLPSAHALELLEEPAKDKLETQTDAQLNHEETSSQKPPRF